MTRMVAFAVLLASTFAQADSGPRKASSLEHYKKGRTAYAAGGFAAAIDEFELAYREHPAPEYLHDIAQAYRRLDKCDAVSYFERYLAAKPDAKNRADVERALAELRALRGSGRTQRLRTTASAARVRVNTGDRFGARGRASIVSARRSRSPANYRPRASLQQRARPSARRTRSRRRRVCSSSTRVR